MIEGDAAEEKVDRGRGAGCTRLLLCRPDDWRGLWRDLRLGLLVFQLLLLALIFVADGARVYLRRHGLGQGRGRMIVEFASVEMKVRKCMTVLGGELKMTQNRARDRKGIVENVGIIHTYDCGGRSRKG